MLFSSSSCDLRSADGVKSYHIFTSSLRVDWANWETVCWPWKRLFSSLACTHIIYLDKWGGGSIWLTLNPWTRHHSFPGKPFSSPNVDALGIQSAGAFVLSLCVAVTTADGTNFILWSLPQKALEGQPQLCLPLVVTAFALLILTNRRLQRVNCIVKYSPFQLCLTTWHLFIAILGMFLLPAAHCHGFTS